MLVYLDNCCFNRPFDDQSQIKIRLETEAKLFVQTQISYGLTLAWSYILDYENSFNPFEERRNAIQRWRKRAVIDVSETPNTIERARQLRTLNIKGKDALHASCAAEAGCDYFPINFLSTDDILLKKLGGSAFGIPSLNPVRLCDAVGTGQRKIMGGR